MDDTARLVAIEEIRQLKSRYFRCLDTKDWHGLRAVFCDDAVFDARASLAVDGASDAEAWVHRGGDAIVAFVRAVAGPLRTVHHGHCHEVKLLPDGTARGVIAMEDRIWVAGTGAVRLHGCGHYHETYRRDPGGWRILTSRLTRLYLHVGAEQA